jgi:hypothetical protein
VLQEINASVSQASNAWQMRTVLARIRELFALGIGLGGSGSLAMKGTKSNLESKESVRLKSKPLSWPQQKKERRRGRGFQAGCPRRAIAQMAERAREQVARVPAPEQSRAQALIRGWAMGRQAQRPLRRRGQRRRQRQPVDKTMKESKQKNTKQTCCAARLPAQK